MQRIAIHSAPRSGSTWLGALFDAHPEVIYKFQPLFSYAFKDYLDENSNRDLIREFFDRISVAKDDFLDQTKSKELGLVPSFKKIAPKAIVYKEVRYHHILENMMVKDKEMYVIGLVRNPLAVINSWWKAPKEFKTDLGWKFEEEWLQATLKNLDKKEEFNGYNKWKEVAYLFLELQEKYPDRFHLLKYQDLLFDTTLEIKKISNFLKLPMSIEQENFVEQSKSQHNKDAYGVFKVKIDDHDWEGQLPLHIVEFIAKDIKGTPLEQFLEI